jgi:hypothetical protein
MENEFKNFEYFISHFAAEEMINKHTQAFKQKLIDKSYPDKIDLEDSHQLAFVFSEFFMASLMANLDILAEYHRWLLVILEQQKQQDFQDGLPPKSIAE